MMGMLVSKALEDCVGRRAHPAPSLGAKRSALDTIDAHTIPRTLSQFSALCCGTIFAHGSLPAFFLVRVRDGHIYPFLVESRAVAPEVHV